LKSINSQSYILAATVQVAHQLVLSLYNSDFLFKIIIHGVTNLLSVFSFPFTRATPVSSNFLTSYGSVSIVMGYMLDDWNSIPGRARIFSLFHIMQTSSGAQPGY
jgi:hypothetical protein